MPDKIVRGTGQENAEIMVVSDYPTSEELSSGKALVGSSGRLIDGYLKNAGWALNKCYCTDFIKTALHLPKDRRKHSVAIQEVKDAFKPQSFEFILANEVRDINPNVIISVGELSTEYLTNRYQILKLRGSILPLSDAVRIDSGTPAAIKPYTRVIPIIHPRDIYAKWIHNAYTQFDVSRAVSHRTNSQLVKEPGLLWIAKSAKALNTWWNERGKYGEYLTVDIETYNTFVTCIGFCADGYEALSVPFIDRTIPLIDRALMMRQVSKILSSPIPKINQNIKFDDDILGQWGWYLNNIAGDTMLLGHTIYPELPKGLDFYTSIYTEIPYYKDEGHEFQPKQGFDTLYYYNAKDALATWRVWREQIKDAKECKVFDFYQRKVWPAFFVYRRMDKRGILIDEAQVHTLETKYGEMLDLRHNLLRTLSNVSSINFNSPKQIANLFYEEMGLPKQYKRNKEGKRVLATDEETAEELVLNYAKSQEYKDIIWNVIWCRKIYKILNFLNVPWCLDGRMRTNSKLTGTKSGRTSMSETINRIFFKNTPESRWYNEDKKNYYYWSQEIGYSFQTIPKHGYEVGDEIVGDDLRSIYVPTPGYSFVEGDGGQAEARVVAVLAEDWDALNEMERTSFKRNKYGIKDDLHTKTAMLVLSKVFEDITEAIRQNFGKKPRHAGNYDMGPKRLALMAHIALIEAIRVLQNFHHISPKIREVFHQLIRTLVTNTHILSTLHGRLRTFYGKLTDDTFREAFSWIPQAVVSDHTKFDTLLPLEDESRDFAYFLSESHDSLFFEVKNEKREAFAARMKYFEEQPLIFDQGSVIRKRQLIIPCELKISDTNWHEMKEVKL